MSYFERGETNALNYQNNKNFVVKPSQSPSKRVYVEQEEIQPYMSTSIDLSFPDMKNVDLDRAIDVSMLRQKENGDRERSNKDGQKIHNLPRKNRDFAEAYFNSSTVAKVDKKNLYMSEGDFIKGQDPEHRKRAVHNVSMRKMMEQRSRDDKGLDQLKGLKTGFYAGDSLYKSNMVD